MTMTQQPRTEAGQQLLADFRDEEGDYLAPWRVRGMILAIEAEAVYSSELRRWDADLAAGSASGSGRGSTPPGPSPAEAAAPDPVASPADPGRAVLAAVAARCTDDDLRNAARSVLDVDEWVGPNSHFVHVSR